MRLNLTMPIAILQRERAPGALDATGAILWWRVGILLIGVVAAALTLVAFLNYSNYRKAYLAQSDSRYLTVAKELRQDMIAGLNIGIRPAENVQLPSELAELALRDSALCFVAVIDDSAGLISSGPLPGQAQQQWQRALAKTKPDSHWRGDHAGCYQIGLPFLNNYGATAGAIVVGYRKANIELAFAQMLWRLGLNLLLCLLLVSVVVLGGVNWLTRRFSAELAEVLAAIDPALAGHPLRARHGEFIDRALVQDIDAFTVATQEAQCAIGQLAEELDVGRDRTAGREMQS